ncbi:hypothetical protein [Alcanivorax quisquiliarum]|uniref:Lipoprotein n=1 Tax=Alcanivorax quisquiliarum TaxID=2933565 RepID=A0ABT0E8J9_9GAMM|nr:hypothetical protein [Alcanivorax quisquiliarum]MCK0538151.1 hypothetical protein [Alcanivorax quisquiliarum]
MRTWPALCLLTLLVACTDDAPPAPPEPVLEGGARQEAPPMVAPADAPPPLEEPVEEEPVEE